MRTYLNTPLTLAAAVTVLAGCASAPAPSIPDRVDVEGFKPVSTNITHKWNKDTSFPFSGGAAIDIDNDGTMEVFVSGGNNQDDSVLAYRDGVMTDIADVTGLSRKAASYGATAVDLNNDGQTDLVIARDDGVWLHINDNGRFDAQKLDYDQGDSEIALTVAVSDIDLDGDVDLYISNFIEYKSWVSSTFNKPAHVRYNTMLRNDGNLNFTDITESSGTGSSQNTFLSVFSDLDQDGYQDLIVSNNTGKLEILHNEGDNTFTKNEYDSGIGYWMGLGVGDFDNDGDQDIAASNVSSTIPTRFLRGDLRDDQTLEQEWVMLRNDGDRVFTDITEDAGLTGQGFGWGIVFEDLNLDGNLDLLAAQSYIKWPPHKLFPLSGRAMLQVADAASGEREFLNTPALNLADKHYGQSAIIADLDGDAKQDVVWINMDGPVLTALNQHSSDVVTLAVPENAKWLGARVTAQSDNGTSYTREVNNAVGMQTDQTPHLSFASVEGDEITHLDVAFADGSTMRIDTDGPGLVRPNSPAILALK